MYIIGIAGNSGSSFGAHLHFELRKTATQAPFNPLSSGIYKTTDNIAPAIQRVVFYKYEEENDIPVIEPFFTSNISGLQKTVDVPSRFFIAVDASDRQNGTSGKLNFLVLTYNPARPLTIRPRAAMKLKAAMAPLAA